MYKEYEEGIKEYTVKRGNLKLKVLNIGAVITEFSINGNNVVIAYEDYKDYLNNTMYLGAIVGRTSGRIKDAKFDKYTLNKNFLDKHNLHGNDLQNRFYEVKEIKNGLELHLLDQEGDYPGDMDLVIKYVLEEDRLVQEIMGKSNKDTLMNLTNHSYFNLEPGQSIENLQLKIESNEVYPIDEESLPLKKINVENTPFDFREYKYIFENINMPHEQFKTTIFIDNPYVLNGSVFLKSDKGLSLEVKTNQDYVVIYTGNYIDQEGRNFANTKPLKNGAICIETQKIPGDTNMVSDYYSKTEFVLKEE